MTNPLPEDYQKIEASASLIAKEKFNIKKFLYKRFILKDNEVYMVSFGVGEKTDSNPKGLYAFWVWYKNNEPYGGMLNCELKDKYDSIDYFQSCMQNAEETIAVINNEKKD